MVGDAVAGAVAGEHHVAGTHDGGLAVVGDSTRMSWLYLIIVVIFGGIRNQSAKIHKFKYRNQNATFYISLFDVGH